MTISELEKDKKEVKVGIGKFGYYLLCEKKYYNFKNQDKNSLKFENLQAKIDYYHKLNSNKFSNNSDTANQEISNFNPNQVNSINNDVKNNKLKENYYKNLKYISDGKEETACF